MNELKELKDISSELIRKNWPDYKDEIYNTPYYDVLWNILENKFEIDNSDVYLILFKKFINNKEINYKKPLFNTVHIIKINDETLLIKGLNSEERKYIHKLCDNIGLHHESKQNLKKKKSKFMYIYKPSIWLWEFTETNPFSKSKEYYEKIELNNKKKKKNIKKK